MKSGRDTGGLATHRYLSRCCSPGYSLEALSTALSLVLLLLLAVPDVTEDGYSNNEQKEDDA